MKTISKRIKALRESISISQADLAKKLKTNQQNINRYENAQVNIPLDMLRKYADFFDVSLDYIFGRCDEPRGQLYEFNPKFSPDKEELRLFIEMCFDPKSPMNQKLKESLFNMVEDNLSGKKIKK